MYYVHIDVGRIIIIQQHLTPYTPLIFYEQRNPKNITKASVPPRDKVQKIATKKRIEMKTFPEIFKARRKIKNAAR